MMTLDQLLAALQQRQVKVYLEQGGLKTQATPGAISAELAAQIRLHKEGLLQLLQQSALRQNQPPICRQNRTDAVPLSYGQERLWMIDQLQGGSPEYNMQFVLQIHGDFDLQTASQVFTTIVERHEVLRTTYHSDDSGAPIQRIQPVRPVQIDLIDLGSETAAEQASRLNVLAAELARQKIDLSADSMLKVVFARTAAGDTDAQCHQGYLLLLMHHIAADGWSMAILQREFINLYQAMTTGQSPDLTPLKVQYADYACWQRQLLAQPDYQLQLDYWLRQLAEIPPLHGVPLDLPRPLIKQYEGAQIGQRLAAETSTALLTLARQHGLTPFMLVHALFAIVLSSHSNQSDIIIGIPQTNRPKAELSQLVGFFINTLVLRVNTAQMTLAELLAQVLRVHTEAQANCDVPFEQLAELLQVQRATSHTPVFQIMLTADADYSANLPSAPASPTSSVQFSPLGCGPIQAKFDLNLDFRLDADGIQLNWIYDVSLFSAPHIRQMSEHFERLAQQIAGDLDVSALSLSGLQLLSEQEIRQQLQVWNPTAQAHRDDVLLQQLFLQQVDVVPQQTALIDDAGELSYQQVFQAAAALCDLLWQYHIVPGDRVAVRLPKGRFQVIATIAVLMAGGVYLPIETNWPAARCEKICQKAECRLNLVIAPEHELSFAGDNLLILPVVSQALSAVLPAQTATQSCYLKQQPTDLAYIIFTSGSTGEPKGVEIEHHSAMNTILEMIRFYQLTATDRVLAVSALSFDLSVFDIFGLLAVGGAVVIPAAASATDPAHWLMLAEKHQVTIWDTVPASAGLLADQLEYRATGCDAPLRHMLLSGDWIPPSLPARLWRLLPGCQVNSLGGATEAAIWSIHYTILTDPAGRKSVPYGRPMIGQSFYILDHRQQLLPAGVTGELYIGGRGVARGYCADPSLTNRQFIWHQGLGTRLYRTGDLGRYLPDGLIEFVGRADHQVKIRGFRIELGEIEVVLAQQPTVDSCLVIAREQAGTDQLIAYLKLKTELEQSAAVIAMLKTELARQLPPYMVPAAFVPVDQWPLTANGKICKKSLPAPVVGAAGGMEHFVGVSTETEIQLASLWADLLGVSASQLSINTDFFAAGGHSLLLIKLMVALRKTFYIELKMQDLLTCQTIAQQAMLIDNACYFARLGQFKQPQDAEVIEVML